MDDEGKAIELSPDPMLAELQAALEGVKFGEPESVGDKLNPILSNANIFGTDLYAAGIGDQIEALVKEELAGPGALRATLQAHV